jgi:2-methylcitrate dehydratase PrpD
MQEQLQSAHRPDADRVLLDIADYVAGFEIRSPRAYEIAVQVLLDALARGLLALRDPGCGRHLGPVVPGATLSYGARVPGTSFELDPVMAAFNIGALQGSRRNGDGFRAAGGHPADSLGAILAVADYRSRRSHNDGAAPLLVRDVLTALIKAHEIQGVLAQSNDFGRRGFDSVLLVRVASAAVATELHAGSRAQILAAVSNAWLDGGSLHCAKDAAGTGSRALWAAADASSRGVRHALLALGGEPGHPWVLSTPRWGFYDALFEGRAFLLERAYGSHCMENESFTTTGPAAFEAAVAGHFPAKQAERIVARFADPAALAALPVNEMLAALVKNS